MACKDDISNIKTELEEYVGRKIMIRGSAGRKKAFEEEVIIANTYPNFFIVKSENKYTNASYKYTDILTNELQVSLFNGTEYFPLVPAITKIK